MPYGTTLYRGIGGDSYYIMLLYYVVIRAGVDYCQPMMRERHTITLSIPIVRYRQGQSEMYFAGRILLRQAKLDNNRQVCYAIGKSAGLRTCVCGNNDT